MIYITGDCHADFRKFASKQRRKLPFTLSEEDSVIVCGDFGLLWAKDETYEYNLKWLEALPFRILWIQGNHENFNMIEEYPIEEWNGGKVRHIVRDKVILLERGQVFHIEDKTFFTFGGASSHDIQGGVLDRDDPDYDELRRLADMRGLPYRILNLSWWKQELPGEEELQEGNTNLSKVGYQVDYVITHCAANRIQDVIEDYYFRAHGWGRGFYHKDILTNYFEELEDKLNYKHWFFGHYHDEIEIDEKHTLLYQNIVPLDSYSL